MDKLAFFTLRFEAIIILEQASLLQKCCNYGSVKPLVSIGYVRLAEVINQVGVRTGAETNFWSRLTSETR